MKQSINKAYNSIQKNTVAYQANKKSIYLSLVMLVILITITLPLLPKLHQIDTIFSKANAAIGSYYVLSDGDCPGGSLDVSANYDYDEKFLYITSTITSTDANENTLQPAANENTLQPASREDFYNGRILNMGSVYHNAGGDQEYVRPCTNPAEFDFKYQDVSVQHTGRWTTRRGLGGVNKVRHVARYYYKIEGTQDCTLNNPINMNSYPNFKNLKLCKVTR